MSESPLMIKSKAFALEVIRACKILREAKCESALINQFLRSGTSIGANIREAFYAHGKVDFVAKLHIALKECSETEYPLLSVWLPSVSAAVVTLVMYIGEMILLSGHLYRFGDGFFFAGIPGIVLAPVDIVVILGSGVMTAIIASFVRNKNT